MLVVDTFLMEFKGKGIGLVADQVIKKGQVVWKYNPSCKVNVRYNL